MIAKASKVRIRMIKENAGNRPHDEDDLPPPEYDGDLEAGMPPKYRSAYERFAGDDEGQRALRVYEKFWGIPYPVEFKEIDIPGPRRKEKRVSLGLTPRAVLVKRRNGKKVEYVDGPYILTCDSKGENVVLLSGKSCSDRKRKLRKVGYAKRTEYYPSKSMESAGSFKAGKYWVHEHNDDGGTLPEVREDQAGNLYYGRSTLKIDNWLRR